MPTAAEIVDNRAIVARIHRRRHHSETSQFDDEEDVENPLIIRDDHDGVTAEYSRHERIAYDDDEVESDNGSANDRHRIHTRQESIPYENASRERRVVGGGKWPRQKYIFNSSSVIQSGYRKRKCDAENCVHQFGNSCADILLQPHLYPHICKNKGIKLTHLSYRLYFKNI